MKEQTIKGVHCILLNKNEPETEQLLKILKLNEEEIDDVLEDQTPNLLNYDDYSIITLSFPTEKTLKTEGFMQATFIINDKKLIIITNQDNEILNHIFDDLSETTNATSILSQMIDTLREDSIDIIESTEAYIDSKEKEIIEGKRDKALLIKMHNLKESLHYIRVITKQNAETVKELTLAGSKYVKTRQFSAHHEDRMNYLTNVAERLREAALKNIDLFVNLMTYKVDERLYKLTIVGSILLIPTILSGIFGMNVALPAIGFWEIISLSTILSVITYFLIK